MKYLQKAKAFLDLTKGLRPLMALIFFLALACSVLEALGLSVLMPFIENLQGNPGQVSVGRFRIFTLVLNKIPPASHTLVLAVALIIIFLIKNIFSYLRMVLSTAMVLRMRVDWMHEIFRYYLRTEYSFILANKQGSLLNDLLNEPGKASKAMKLLLEYVAKVVLSISLYILMLMISIKATIFVTVIGIILFGLVNKTADTYVSNIGKARLLVSRACNAISAEALNGLRQIKIFSIENKTLGSFAEKTQRHYRMMIKFEMVRVAPQHLLETTLVILVASMVIFFHYRGINFRGNFPIWATFFVIVYRLQPNISFLVSQRMEILSLLPSLSLVYNLKKVSTNVEDLYSGRKTISFNNSLSLKNIWFEYTKNAPVLRDINITVEKGQIVAIVGPSGSGKSTIVDLIARLYEPQKGTVILDGKDVKETSLKSWRSMIGYVSQDTFLFNGTIQDNILIGNPSAINRDVEEAARMASAHDFIINLKEGYNTVIGDRGLTLSGGQRQRIAIARIVIRNPQIFIFDEATSSLDIETEAMVQKAIENVSRNQTVIYVAHRLDTIKNADYIYVLHEGRIVEEGKHSNLLSQEGLYWRLYKGAVV